MRLRLGVEALLDAIAKAAKRTCRGEPVVVHAALPTGYGKSEASITLASRLEELVEDYAERVIHVAPTRCLVEDLLRRARERGVSAYGQCMFLDYAMKDPFFLGRLVFTTMDSYSLNFYKIPVEEVKLIQVGASRGHYDVPAYAIRTSVTVFDEYHLFTPGDSALSEDKPSEHTQKAWTVLLHMIDFLVRKCACPVVLETATPRPQLLGALRKQSDVKVISLEYDSARNGIEQSGDRIIVGDAEFAEDLLNSKYRTRVVERAFVEYVVEASKKLRKPLLVACNTITEALKVYEEVKKSTDYAVEILHSQFTLADRRKKVEKVRTLLEKRAEAVIVATQVIEVGVDLDFDSMITNAAPLTPLIQRAGRVGRKPRAEEFEVHVVFDKEAVRGESYSGVYDLNLTRRTVKLLKQCKDRGLEVGWRLLSSQQRVEGSSVGYVPVNKLSETLYGELELSINNELWRILGHLVSPLVEASSALKLLEKLGSLVREDIIAPVLVEDVEPGSYNSKELKLPDSLIPCKASKIGFTWRRRGAPQLDLKRAEKILRVEDNSVYAVVETLEEELRVVRLASNQAVKALIRGVIWIDGKPHFLHAFVARSDAYDLERGLLA